MIFRFCPTTKNAVSSQHPAKSKAAPLKSTRNTVPKFNFQKNRHHAMRPKLLPPANLGIFQVNGRASIRFRQENPCEGIIQIAKDPDSLFAGVFAKHLKHPREAIFHIIAYKNSAPGTGPEHVAFCELANVIRIDLHTRDVTIVQQLRITRVEIRVRQELVLMP